jgi:AraC family transcriptional regulator, ethanolamine operon transcriptional activator
MTAPDTRRQGFSQRPQIACVAREYLHTHRQRTVSISELCAIVGVPERTLHLAFHEVYGMPPKQYMKRQRLDGARRALLQAGAMATVSQIAMDWGFLHLGRFAADYRMHFGETPSETLLRHKRAA